MGTGVFPVDLIDHHHRLEAVLHRLAQDKFGLGLRSLVSVDHEQYAVDHLHDAFHFAPEVGVARSIDDVDVVFVPLERCVLRPDGDPLFFLEIHRVHDPLLQLLVGLKGSRLTEQLVNQSGLTVVDVGDDGDVANIFHTIPEKEGGLWRRRDGLSMAGARRPRPPGGKGVHPTISGTVESGAWCMICITRRKPSLFTVRQESESGTPGRPSGCSRMASAL